MSRSFSIGEGGVNFFLANRLKNDWNWFLYVDIIFSNQNMTCQLKLLVPGRSVLTFPKVAWFEKLPKKTRGRDVLVVGKLKDNCQVIHTENVVLICWFQTKNVRNRWPAKEKEICPYWSQSWEEAQRMFNHNPKMSQAWFLLFFRANVLRICFKEVVTYKFVVFGSIAP